MVYSNKVKIVKLNEMDLKHVPKQFILEFLELYKSQECLWKLTHDDYTDRVARQRAYDLLVEKFQEVDPDATRETVARKIDSIRGCFRKEKRRVEESIMIGSPNAYKPKLWYYDFLLFLKDQEGAATPNTFRRILRDKQNKNRRVDNESSNSINASEWNNQDEKPTDLVDAKIHPITVISDHEYLNHQEYEEDSSVLLKKAVNSSMWATNDGIAEITILEDSPDTQSSVASSTAVSRIPTVSSMESPKAQNNIKNKAASYQLVKLSPHLTSAGRNTDASKSGVNCKGIVHESDRSILLEEAKRMRFDCEDDIDVMCRNFGNKMRKLPPNRVAIVEKLITDLLFEAQAGNVNQSTRISLIDLNKTPSNVNIYSL